jgi:hypothetical protein
MPVGFPPDTKTRKIAGTYDKFRRGLRQLNDTHLIRANLYETKAIAFNGLADHRTRKMALEMHLKLGMRALICFLILGTFGNVAVGEGGISNSFPLNQTQAQQQLASSFRVQETKRNLDAAREALEKAQKDSFDSPVLAQLKVEKEEAQKKYDQAVAQLQSDLMQAQQNDARQAKLTGSEQGSKGKQASSGGKESSKGGMPPMPPPPPPPKKEDSKEEPKKEDPPKQAASPTSTPQPPKETPVQTAKEAELLKQLVNPGEITPKGELIDQNAPSQPSALTQETKKLSEDTVRQSEQIAAKIVEVASLPQKTTGNPIAATNSPTKPQNSPRATAGLAGAMATPISAAGASPPKQVEERLASAPPPGNPGQRALRTSPGGPLAAAPAGEEETPSAATPFNLASLLGGSAEAPAASETSTASLRSERLTRSLAKDRLVNPNAPVLPNALRAVMESNKLVVGTPGPTAQ